MKHFKISVTGKVQGVWFRGTAKHTAMRLGITGFARNEPDGSVYIEAEGEDEPLQQFLAWCHEGSREAEVEEVAYTEHDPAGHQGFETY